MTNFQNDPDLSAIACEADVEIRMAETIEVTGSVPGDHTRALETTEIGYYEAELRSLRDAATTLSEAEHRPS